MRWFWDTDTGIGDGNFDVIIDGSCGDPGSVLFPSI